MRYKLHIAPFTSPFHLFFTKKNSPLAKNARTIGDKIISIQKEMRNIYLIVIIIVLFVACTGQKAQRLHDLSDEEKLNILYERFVNASEDYVLVCAHRGYWRSAPENSYNAVKNAMDLGCDIIEIDVRKTKDGELIVMHDKTIDRTTTGKGRIEHLTLDSIKTVFLRNGVRAKTHHRVPTLEEIMLLVKGKPILVNLDKAWACLPEAYEVLKKTGTVKQAIFKGNDPVELLRKKAGPILDSIIYMPMVWPTDYSIYKRDSIVGPIDYVKGFINDYGPVAFETIFDKEDSPVLDAVPIMKENDVAVLVVSLWDELCASHSDERAIENPDAHWGWIVDQGANVIMTDRPSELLDYLRSKGLHD